MREIKFRAWDKENKEMLQDTPHRFVKDEYEMVDTGLRTVGNGGLTDRPALERIKIGEIDITDNYEIMQYTGLKDKNGKEIYEGDVVKWNHDDDGGISQVKWGGKYPAFDLFDLDGDSYYWESNILSCEPVMEIIGNIYENKELL